jgi:hypothetical protein
MLKILVCSSYFIIEVTVYAILKSWKSLSSKGNIASFG